MPWSRRSRRQTHERHRCGLELLNQVIRKQVNYRVLGIMLLGGLPGVVLGSVLFKHVAAHGPKTALYFVLGAIIVFTSGWHLFRHFRPAGIARPAAARSKWISAIMFPIGAEVGFAEEAEYLHELLPGCAGDLGLHLRDLFRCP